MSAATAASAVVPDVGAPCRAVLSRTGKRPARSGRRRRAASAASAAGCSSGVENGRAVAVKGDPDSAVSKGSACVKGYHSVQALYGRDRITRAMVRRDGALVEVPLAEALDLVAQQAARDRAAARQGQRRRLWVRPVDHSRRLRRVEAVQGGAGHEQRRDQRAPLRGQRDGRPREQLRPRWRDRMLRGHRARRRLRALGRQPRRNRPGALLPDAGPTAVQPRRPHHPPVHPHHANELRRRPDPAAPCRMRSWRSPTPSATRSWPASWCIREFVDRYVAFKRGKTDIGYGLSDERP